MDDLRLKYIKLAQELTGSNDIKILVAAAKELEDYDLKSVVEANTKRNKTFVEFLSYIKIKHPTHGGIPFTPHPFQRNIANRLQEMLAPSENYGVMINGARQMGISMMTALFALYAANELGKGVLIISPKLVMSDGLHDHIRFAISNTRLNAGMTSVTRHSSHFDNDGWIRHTTYGLMKGPMSYCPDIIIAADLQFCSFADTQALMDYFYIFSSQRTKLVLTGGLLNRKGLYYETWTDAHTARFSNTPGKLKFEKIHVPFHHHPNRDEEWAKIFKEQLGEDQFNREFDPTADPPNKK
jgi:hypothetical protein